MRQLGVLPNLSALHAHLRSGPAAVVGSPRANGQSPQQVIAQLTEGFETFKATHSRELKAQSGNFQKAIDDLSAKVAAVGLGGGIVHTESAPDPGYTELFSSYARNGVGAADLHKANHEGDRAKINSAMTVSPGEAGGYLAPVEWDRQVRKAQTVLSPMRQIASVISTSVRGFSTIWNKGGWGTGWVGETAPRPSTSSAELVPVTFASGEIYAFPAVSQQLIDDADFPIEKWLSDELSEVFQLQEGPAFLAGDGVNKPRGLLTYATGGLSANEHPGGALTVAPSGDASNITLDGLIDFVFGLPAPYRQNARWLMNSMTAARIRRFKDIGGNYIWQPAIDQDKPDRLLGYPVTIDENMPAIAANAMPIAFGDFKRGYVINDRKGLRLLRDPYTMKPYVGFYATKRVGGGVLDPRAIRLLKVAAG